MKVTVTVIKVDKIVTGIYLLTDFFVMRKTVVHDKMEIRRITIVSTGFSLFLQFFLSLVIPKKKFVKEESGIKKDFNKVDFCLK